MHVLWKKEPDRLPLGQIMGGGGGKMHAGGLLGQHSFLRKYKMAHEDSHSTDSSVSGDAVLTHAILGFNYTAKLH